jgi:hypothetical protein
MNIQTLHWKKLVVLGLTAGGLQVAAGVIMYLEGLYFIQGSFFISLAVLLSCIVTESRWYRNSILHGEINFVTSFLVCAFIGVSTGVMYALYNVISISFFYPHFLEDWVRSQTAYIQASGLDSDQTKAMIETIKKNTTMPRIALSNLISLSTWGIIMSLVTSLILRKKKSTGLDSPS